MGITSAWGGCSQNEVQANNLMKNIKFLIYKFNVHLFTNTEFM